LTHIAINEIFYSIQGEGFHTGTPAVFIRTAGCNLACDYCDTDFTEKERLSRLGVLKRMAAFPCKFVVITGGEPTIQKTALRSLIKLLHEKGYFVALETNGTSTDTLGADWITVSPKSHLPDQWKLRRGNELKLIYEKQDLPLYENSDFSHYFLQPKEIRTGKPGKGKRDIQKTRKQWRDTIAAVKKNPKWRLSLQIHKELGIK
jgi:organic radical activating enzyme